MAHSTEPLGPTEAVAQRVKDLRRKRGLTGARLADCMTEVGVPWDRSIVANLENGRRNTVSVVELLALADVLNVAPVHLLAPPSPQPALAGEGEPTDDAPYAVTPTRAVPIYRVRSWIRGERPLPRSDPRMYHTEIPRQEWDGLMEERIAHDERERGGDGAR